MKAEELRIGNYMQDKKSRLCEVVTLSKDPDKNSILAIKGATTAFPLAPIPLTEEWLVRFGAIHVFNSTRATDTSYRYGRFNLTYKKAYKYWYVTDSESDGYLSKVEFVHEWQNFVFVMNGEELEANP